MTRQGLQENDLVALLVDIPAKRLHRGEIGTVIQVSAPTEVDFGWVLLEFANGVQTDIDNMTEIVKLSSSHRRTLKEWAGKTQIFALVFTDIVDSTALANQLGDESWINLLLKHFAVARRLISKHKGHEIKIIGDSFMAIFRTACDAFDFSLALQEDTGDDRIRIRAGVHVGSPRIIEDDIFGNMVNYTKRVESTDNHHGLRLRLSDVAKNQIADEGAQRHCGLRFESLELAFKRISRATEGLDGCREPVAGH